MSSQPSERSGPRALVGQSQPDERRGWLSHGLAALAISVLGLAVAGSVALTTNAQTTQHAAGSTSLVDQANTHVLPAAGVHAVPGTLSRSGQRRSPVEVVGSVTTQGALEAFAPRDGTTGGSSEQVRAAIVKERAAQRAEDMSKTAEDLTRSVQAAGTKLRSKKLAAADRAIRETAVRIADERRQRAIAARVAAETARRQAEEAASTSTASTTSPDPTTPGTIPSGGHGVSPVPGAVVGAGFGDRGIWARYHTGLDFRASEGTPIRAVKAGVVLFASNTGNWAGNHVAIMHADGMTTMSCHMSRIAVHAGQTVRTGQVIGYVGHTGRAFGAHLHFELYPRGIKYGDLYKAIDPTPWLRSNGVFTH